MNNNQEMINDLLQSDYLNTLEIIKAFEKVDRADFVPEKFKFEAYENFPLEIGHGQTISQPATVAFMLERLQPKSGHKILDVGSGSGWQSGLLANIAGASGKVIGLELREDLVNYGRQNLKKYNFKNLEIRQGNGYLGLPDEAPFDRIIVAAAPESVPEVLKHQLKIGGRLVLPVGRGLQDIIVIDKIDEDSYEESIYPGFSFVPLIDSRK